MAETVGARCVLQIQGCPQGNGARAAVTVSAVLGMKSQAQDALHVVRASTVDRLACRVLTVARAHMHATAEPALVWNAGLAPIRTRPVPRSAPRAAMLLCTSPLLPVR
jgi:hypothetical protein